MDILYIVGKGSGCGDLELRSSLRSIDKYGLNVGRVFVCGHCPDWLSDAVTRIPCEDIYKNYPTTHGERNANVLAKMLRAVDTTDIGEEFLVSFDDHFYCKSVDFDRYPYYVRSINGSGELPQHHEGETPYRRLLADTREYLERHGLPTLNFALHRNMHVSRQAVAETRKLLDEIVQEAIPCDRFVLIGNWILKHHGISYEVVRDVKFGSGAFWWKTATDHVFSTADFGWGSGLAMLLSSMYNEKSKFEL